MQLRLIRHPWTSARADWQPVASGSPVYTHEVGVAKPDTAIDELTAGSVPNINAILDR